MKHSTYAGLSKIASDTELIYEAQNLPVEQRVAQALAASYMSAGKRIPITTGKNGYQLGVVADDRLDTQSIRDHIDKLVALDTLRQLVSSGHKSAGIRFYKKYGPVTMTVGDESGNPIEDFLISPEIQRLKSSDYKRVLSKLFNAVPELELQVYKR